MRDRARLGAQDGSVALGVGARSMNRLSETVAELVHTRSVEILSEVGFCVPEKESLSRLEAAGFLVDRSSQMVRITTELLDEALSRLSLIHI